MSIFGGIMSKIFHHPKAQTQAQAAPAQQAQPAEPASFQPAQAAQAPAQPQSPQTGSAQTQSQPQVDVAAVLDAMAADNPEKLNWRTSIVDLMKLVSMDSSLTARKQLASELGYSGDTNDSATMNIWLHKQVMRKLAENGGVVPDSLH